MMMFWGVATLRLDRLASKTMHKSMVENENNQVNYCYKHFYRAQYFLAWHYALAESSSKIDLKRIK